MDVMSPFEVASGCDVVEIGRQYPGLAHVRRHRQARAGPGARRRSTRTWSASCPRCARGAATSRPATTACRKRCRTRTTLYYRKRCVEFGTVGPRSPLSIARWGLNDAERRGMDTAARLCAPYHARSPSKTPIPPPRPGRAAWRYTAPPRPRRTASSSSGCPSAGRESGCRSLPGLRQQTLMLDARSSTAR